MKPLLYLDHAATTATDPRVLEAMLPFFSEDYGNPSSLYRSAGRARQALQNARSTVAEVLGARPKEVVFTGCGTESDNLAIRGVALARRRQGRHIITTPIEHSAVLQTCQQLQQVFGYRVTYVPVDSAGMVDPDEIGRAITPETTLISVMYANNEVGTIQPIAEIGRIARQRGVTFHTDAVQAGGALDLDVERLHVDLLSLSGHKLYAPKGVGVLYVRQGTPILPTQTGGGQEFGLRSGTENVPYAVGMAHALRLAHDVRASEGERLRSLRDRLIRGVLEAVPDARLTGHPTERLPGNASFCFGGLEGEALLLRLDVAGICASTGSACASMEEAPSHVLTAMGIDVTEARGSLRLTLGRENDDEDVARVLGVLPRIVADLRAMSPIYAV
ncbi:MAG: aminotransferase class V-fold PLP-dependent enzyme [Chloroflexi bacterium]|nr:aminotransferase class V-fold PLP-dependent enzyme [Chloroflexota bacterium]